VSGRSTRQIQEAPRSAYYVVPNAQTRSYYRDLADRYGRSDLRIETPDFFDARWRETIIPVVVDHAVMLTYNQRMNYDVCRARGDKTGG